MAGKAYVTRMPVGIAGNVSRLNEYTGESVLLDNSKPFAAYGIAGKYSAGKFVPLVAGDVIGDVTGFLVRPFPTQSITDLNTMLGSGINVLGDAMKRGYMTVNIGSTGTTAVKNGPVYIRVAAPTATSPLGSVCIVADATASNTPQLTNAYLMGAGDADGNVEIAYNI